MFSIIYLCYVTCHTQWALVTYVRACLKCNQRWSIEKLTVQKTSGRGKHVSRKTMDRSLNVAKYRGQGTRQGHLNTTFWIQLFRQRLSHESVKAYATMPIGIMGSKSLALFDWGSRWFSNKERERTNAALCCFLPSRWNTLRFTQAAVKMSNYLRYEV